MKRRGKDFIAELESPEWAQAEFEQAPLVDRRLGKRLITIASDFARQPGASIPQACGTKAKSEGAYGFLENEFVEPQQILIGHRQASLKRLAREPVGLAVQDSTSFNFSHLPQTQGLGFLANRGHPQLRGLWLHSTLCFSPAGLPLSLVAARFWSRAQPTGKREAYTYKIPFVQKESVCWWESWKASRGVLAQLPQPNLWVNISDTEGDIFEVLVAARDQPSPRVELLIRSCHDRRLANRSQRLWGHLAEQPPAGTLQVRVARQEDQPARLATVQIRFCEVVLKPPARKSALGRLTVWAVEAREMNSPGGTEPILWRLVSTLPVTTPQAAMEKVHWYSVRWSIEVFHKIIKSVCRAEDSQLKTAQHLERALMIDLVVAWRIQVLTLVGRQSPALPASDIFAESEWKALYSYIHRTRSVPTEPPGLGEMMLWIARLGGFLGTDKAHPHPGSITLSRGLSRLSDLSEMWAIQNTSDAKSK